MNKLLLFSVFCLENYKIIHNLRGKAAITVFQKYNVFEYINDCYDILHSQGRLSIICNIDEYIAHRENSRFNLSPF